MVEEAFKNEIEFEIYDEQIGMMETVLDVEEIASEMMEIRKEFCKY